MFILLQQQTCAHKPESQAKDSQADVTGAAPSPPASKARSESSTACGGARGDGHGDAMSFAHGD